MPSAQQGFFARYGWEIAVCAAMLFFIILFIFHTPISKWLDGKTDFVLPESRKSTLVAVTPRAAGKPPRAFGKYERRCREIIEGIYQRPFPSVRPNFLKRSNGFNMELDCYNADLKLALEYQGIQHYKYWPRFHRTMAEFDAQLQRDREKREICRRLGITLVEVPYTVKFDKLEPYIKTQLRNLGRL